MAKYSVIFFCNECSKVHPLGVAVVLDDGPADKQSIGDFYAGKELPPEVATLISNESKCPNTGRTTTQEDNKQVFIVPVSD